MSGPRWPPSEGTTEPVPTVEPTPETNAEPTLALAARVAVTTAEGPGRRFAVWVQGCTLRCPGCCNPQMFARGRGMMVPVATVVAELQRAAHEHAIEGLTVLGGEPLQQLPAVTALCEAAQGLGLGVLVFSGYRLEEAARQRPGWPRLWHCIDTLVDGRYDQAQPEPRPEHGGRRFIGSRNQGLRHRTDRYRDPLLWQGVPRVEVHLGPGGELSAHGEPGALGELLRALGVPPGRSKPISSVG